MENIDKLKEIFLSDDEEDYDYNLKKISDWEKTYRENKTMVKWQQHDITKNIMTLAKDSLVAISLRLCNDRKITEQERMTLWAKQDAMNWIISLGTSNAQDVMDGIKQEISQAINTTN